MNQLTHIACAARAVGERRDAIAESVKARKNRERSARTEQEISRQLPAAEKKVNHLRNIRAESFASAEWQFGNISRLNDVPPVEIGPRIIKPPVTVVERRAGRRLRRAARHSCKNRVKRARVLRH